MSYLRECYVKVWENLRQDKKTCNYGHAFDKTTKTEISD